MSKKLSARIGLAVSLAVAVPALADAAPVPATVDDAPRGSAAADVWAIAARAKQAKGVEQAATVYALWNQWDLSDPIAIAAALKSLADDASLDPSARLVARAYAALARLQLGDAAGARFLATKTGALDRWMIVGPFDHEGRAGFVPEIGPEIDRDGVVSPTLTYDGKGHNAEHWRVLPADATPYGAVDLSPALRPASAACVFATTFVALPESTKKATAATLHIGASGSVRVYWNGANVGEDEPERLVTFDRFASDVTIEPNWNRVLVKVCGLDRLPSFSLALVGANGEPIEGLRVEADPKHSSPKEATKQLGKKDELKATSPKPKEESKPVAKKPDEKKPEAKDEKKPEKKPEKAVEKAEKKDDANKEEAKKPIVVSTPKVPSTSKTQSLFQVLAARATSPTAKAGDLEALARYLHDTTGDDPTRPESRDLARRAAEMEPTVASWILAGELAEDANQRRAFVDKAAAIDPKAIEVLYARASLAAIGSDPSSALPLFDGVLAASPDHLGALFGRIDLLTIHGLPRTARAEVEKALGVRPRARGLLNREASLLAVDSAVDAEEVRARSLELVMTTGTYLSDRLADAVDGRDLEKARAIVARWRALDPTSDRMILEGASALEKLGDATGAVALYEAGLEIAPEDFHLLLGLADVEGRLGKRDRQLAIYRQTYARWPVPALAVYLEAAEQSPPREDEAFAEASTSFLKRRSLPSQGFDNRYLSEVSVTTVQPSGLASRFKQVVFQPLTKEAADRAKRFGFGFQADIESVTIRSAKIYRKDGKIDDATNVGTASSSDPSLSTYTSAKTFFVLLPNLDAGDVVEIRYRVDDTTPRNAYGDYFGEITYVQNPDPTVHEEYVLRVPKGRELSIGQPSINALFTDETKGELRTLHWTAQDVPGVVPEANMPPWPEVLSHVHVSTYKDWSSLAAWYWSFIKDQFALDDAVRAKVKELVKGKTKEADKVAAIYDWVVQETRYVALEFGVHGFLPYRCAQVFARGFGDCKDKATLLVAMLGEAGIDASPVLVRTSSVHGDFDTATASLAVFDHMIAYVPSLDLYLDGTAADHGSTELPSGDRGALALVIDKGAGKIVHLPDAAADKSVRTLSVEAKMEKASASVDMSMQGTGVFAPWVRDRYRSGNATFIHDELPAELSAVAWEVPTTSDLDALESTPTLKSKGKGAIGDADKERRTLPIFSYPTIGSSLAPTSSRKLDECLFAKRTYDERYDYVLPPGGSLERVPEAKKGTSPFGSYAVEVEQTKAGVKVHTHLTLEVTRVHPAEYDAFRAFLRDAGLAVGQTVVVKTPSP